MSKSPCRLHELPIRSRPPLLTSQRIRGLVWVVVFNIGCLMVHGSQLVFLLPLRLLIALAPVPCLQRLYETGVRWTKGCFGELVVLMCQWFSPTQLVVTLGGDNLKEDIVVIRERGGCIVKLNLPERLVLIANHQIYADWWYLWCLTYRTCMHRDVLIILKDSLKWIPIVGWGMQIYHFIFVARSWSSDRFLLSDKLSKLAARIRLHATPLAFMIFPEGTLVSKDTRPVSKNFAQKSGIEDMRNTLLPRSTGLHYCLRSLSSQIPDLHLLDVTIAYEGIPPQQYGQSYYTLRSIFLDGVPPPRIHMHLRLYDVHKDVPLGDVSLGTSHTSTTEDAPTLAMSSCSGHGISRADREREIEPTPQEVAQFEQWLRKLWREKDALIDRYLTTGTFLERPIADERKQTASLDHSPDLQHTYHAGELEIPMELRSKWEILEAFGYFAPLLVWAAWRSTVV